MKFRVFYVIGLLFCLLVLASAVYPPGTPTLAKRTEEDVPGTCKVPGA
jgi:hypothetical protein